MILVKSHVHKVKYKDKKGNIRNYSYDYGKVGKKKPLRKIKER